MSTTKTDLCNYGLFKVGGAGEGTGSYKINKITGSGRTDTEKQCGILYPLVRKEVLVRAWWQCATKYSDAGAADTDVAKGDWEYAFALPSDYLGKGKQIHEDHYRSTKHRFQSEYDKEITQNLIFTNEYTNSAGDKPYIKYIFDYDPTDTSLFKSLLYNAIATKLAAELAPVLLADKGSMRRYFLLQEYENMILPIAEGVNADQQGDNEDQGEFTTLTSRIP